MKRIVLVLPIIMTALSACSPHFHLDLLGRENLEEILLAPSPAKEKILIVDVEGVISSTLDTGLFSREKNAVSRVFERLEKAAKDPWVRAVILRLDTPGGEVTASDIIYHEVLRFKERTRRPIMAHPTTLTGSIGVISVFPNVEQLMSKIGVKVNVIKSGAAKDSGGPFRDMTEEEKKIFQGIIDEYYVDFLNVVSKNRKDRIPAEKLRTIADGRVYTAPQALKLEIIDAIGYFDDAFRKALSLASLQSAKLVSYTYYPKTKTNIYAGRLGDFSPLDAKVLESTLAALKTGFYYLWLPQTQ